MNDQIINLKKPKMFENFSIENSMKIKNLKLKIALLLVASGYLLVAAPLRAQESLRTFTIVPPTIQQALNPGQNIEGNMKVINDSDRTLTFTATIQDFIVLDTIGTPNLIPPNTLSKRFSAASWIGVTPALFTVEPHKKQTLNYYLQVPLDARPGGHYAAVVFKPVNTLGVQGTGASVETQVGSLFYVGVNGPIVELSQVTKFFTNPFSEYGPVNIQTQIKNLGDLHIKPQGTLTISDMFGRTLKTEKLNEVNIFPTAARDYANSFGQQFMAGRFKASLLASYGQNNNLPLAATVYFWVFPWKLTLIVILAIAALVLGVKYWKKQKNNPTS